MDYVAAGRQRPGLVTTLAILAFIVAALCLLCGGVFVMHQITILGRDETARANPAQMADAYVQGPRLLELATSLEILFGSVVLVVVGIGLLSMKRWARVLALAYSAVTILVQLGYILFKLLWGYMAFQELSGSPPAMKHMFIAFGPRVFWAGLLLLHALAMGTIMLRPRIVAAFEEERG